jgi:DNA-binding SARP family transcriptional activator
MVSTVEVCLLGEFGVTVDGVPVSRWRAGKARGLFQFLLVNRNRLIPGDRLREVLWPHAPRSGALKVAVHAVRKVLGELSADMTVVQDGGGYLLRAAAVSVDAERVAALADQARAVEHAGQGRRALALHRAVARQHTGEFLAGERADWVVEHREWLRATVLHSLRTLREHALRDGDHLDVLATCRQILALDPFAEDAYQSLMAWHACRGELGRVRGWYDLCASRLGERLGVEPSHRTRRILVDALRRYPVSTDVPPVAATLAGTAQRGAAP